MTGNFKTVSSKFNYVKYAETAPGTVIAEGHYLGTKDGTYGIEHQIKANNGEVTVLNSSGHLNYLIKQNVTAGDCIQVTYRGTETISKGKFKGKEMHQFQVGIDQNQRSRAAVSVVESASSDDDSGPDYSDEPLPEPPPNLTPATMPPLKPQLGSNADLGSARILPETVNPSSNAFYNDQSPDHRKLLGHMVDHLFEKESICSPEWCKKNNKALAHALHGLVPVRGLKEAVSQFYRSQGATVFM